MLDGVTASERASLQVDGCGAAWILRSDLQQGAGSGELEAAVGIQSASTTSSEHVDFVIRTHSASNGGFARSMLDVPLDVQTAQAEL